MKACGIIKGSDMNKDKYIEEKYASFSEPTGVESRGMKNSPKHKCANCRVMSIAIIKHKLSRQRSLLYQNLELYHREARSYGFAL
jgi:hypothetical protein